MNVLNKSADMRAGDILFVMLGIALAQNS